MFSGNNSVASVWSGALFSGTLVEVEGWLGSGFNKPGTVGDDGDVEEETGKGNDKGMGQEPVELDSAEKVT